MDTVVYDRIDNLEAALAALQADFDGNALLSAGSAVKSVQRGYVKGKMASNGGTVVDISAVDNNKSTLIIDLHSDAGAVMCYCLEGAAIKLRTSNSMKLSNEFAWQVIEFY